MFAQPGTVLTGYIHYRMVLGVTGKALTSFGSSKEFVAAVRDTLTAHARAYEDAKILHCDVGPANIIITHDGGILIGWGFCRRLLTDDGPGSAAILLDQTKPQGRIDDLEPFLHVLSWVTLRYLDNTMNTLARATYLSKTFDEARIENGIASGGEHKELHSVGDAYILAKLTFKKTSSLSNLLREIAAVFRWRYAEIPEKERHSFTRIQNHMEQGTLLHTALELLMSVSSVAMQNLADASWLLDPLNRHLFPTVE
ncbi:uncharacterized protein EDB91DRAFT_1061813 [Suillus paluster]|uniref:uncharacterized protein n=1 Tax=Suillus paluster TaxID=48578 RepID=UPI001B873044|nr:uncharacterized protein EDB91DRAFT_1061813 [Suillus paluster]KAG1726059.1 hypothetical protein EDB91DRAFT_1061813 [Suillus paluster]